MVKCLAQGHKCHGIRTHILLLTPELESGKLDRLAWIFAMFCQDGNAHGFSKMPHLLGNKSSKMKEYRKFCPFDEEFPSQQTGEKNNVWMSTDKYTNHLMS